VLEETGFERVVRDREVGLSAGFGVQRYSGIRLGVVTLALLMSMVSNDRPRSWLISIPRFALVWSAPIRWCG
jgi:hypothetical protein